VQRAWAAARIVYAIFFLATGIWILLAVTTGALSAPAQPTREAAEFMQSLTNARFVDPLLAGSYVAGGLCLLFNKTAPLGLVFLAPSVAVILFFHLFLSGEYFWGPAVAGYFLLIAWRYRRAFEPLWTYRGI
jgi:hypothetical protein